MIKHKKGLRYSFGYALKGCATLFRSERNVKIHIFALSIAIVLGIFLEISTVEWCIIALCAGGVLAAEAINTAIEELVDLLHPARSGKAGRVKDIAAGAVLVIATSALVCGLLIFVPKLVDKF